MGPETEFEEMAECVEVGVPFMVDLNQATVEELETLAGIGPSLAQRIVAYREEQGGFQSPEELTAVPGVGQAAYEHVADRLTVTPVEAPPTTPELPAVEAPELAAVPALEPDVEPEAPPSAAEPELLEEAAPAPELPAPEVAPSAEAEEEEEVLEEEPILPAEPVPALEEVPMPPPAEAAAPAPTPPAGLPFAGGWLYWIGAALLGAVLGMVFALLVFYGINGALDLSSSPAFVGVQKDVAGLQSDVNVIQGQIESIEMRLDTLQVAADKVDVLEKDVGGLQEDAQELGQRATKLEEDLGEAADRLDVLQEQSNHVTLFFGRLGELLQEFFGQEGADEPAPESPVVTPTPTQ